MPLSLVNGGQVLKLFRCKYPCHLLRQLLGLSRLVVVRDVLAFGRALPHEALDVECGVLRREVEDVDELVTC